MGRGIRWEDLAAFPVQFTANPGLSEPDQGQYEDGQGAEWEGQYREGVDYAKEGNGTGETCVENLEHCRYLNKRTSDGNYGAISGP